MSRRPWNDSEYDSTWISRLIASEVMTPLPERSVARRSLAICALAERSSVDVAADVLVSGVPMALPFMGVDAEVPVVVLASSPLPAFAAAFAACASDQPAFDAPSSCAPSPQAAWPSTPKLPCPHSF